MMKRLLFTCVAVMIAVFAFAQGEETVKDLKREKEVLQLNTQLKKLQLDFEKEKMKYNYTDTFRSALEFEKVKKINK